MTNEDKKLDIFIVEDTPDNMKVAQKYFNKRKDIQPEYALCYNQAMTYLGNKKYGGVITDVFMPENTGINTVRVGKLSKEFYEHMGHKINQYINRASSKFVENNLGGEKRINRILIGYSKLGDEISRGENAPLGILIAEKAEKLKIPYILATSLWHHNQLAEPVLFYAYTFLKNCLVKEGAINGKEFDDYGKNLKITKQYWDETTIKLLEKIRGFRK